MAIRGFEKKDPMAGLNQLMQLMNQMNQMQEKKIARQSSNIENLIKLTSDMDSMAALGNRVNEIDISFDNMGDDETGDVLKS